MSHKLEMFSNSTSHISDRSPYGLVSHFLGKPAAEGTVAAVKFFGTSLAGNQAALASRALGYGNVGATALHAGLHGKSTYSYLSNAPTFGTFRARSNFFPFRRYRKSTRYSRRWRGFGGRGRVARYGEPVFVKRGARIDVVRPLAYVR